MPVIANENSRLGWLLGRLANRRNRVVDLVRRLTGMGPAGAVNPSLFAKFLRMMDDVAAATREEVGLLGQIEDIEKKHRTARDNKCLRQAMPSAKTANSNPVNQPEQEAKSHSHGLLKLIAFWYLFMRQKINHKKQDLTVD